jgi:hypothetical protein
MKRHTDIPRSRRFVARCFSALVFASGCAFVYSLPFVMGFRA